MFSTTPTPHSSEDEHAFSPPMPNSRIDKNRKAHIRHRIMRIVLMSITIVLLAAFTFTCWLVPATVTGASMEPTFTEHELLLVDKLCMYLGRPSRGDIVIFPHPTEPNSKLIKRVIAFEGEIVEIVDGQVFVNGQALDESQYISNPGGNMAPIQVPKSFLFVLGDNRTQSLDSRNAVIGCVPLCSLDGIVRVRIAPLDRLNIYV